MTKDSLEICSHCGAELVVAEVDPSEEVYSTSDISPEFLEAAVQDGEGPVWKSLDVELRHAIFSEFLSLAWMEGTVSAILAVIFDTWRCDRDDPLAVELFLIEYSEAIFGPVFASRESVSVYYRDAVKVEIDFPLLLEAVLCEPGTEVAMGPRFIWDWEAVDLEERLTRISQNV